MREFLIGGWGWFVDDKWMSFFLIEMCMHFLKKEGSKGVDVWFDGVVVKFFEAGKYMYMGLSNRVDSCSNMECTLRL